MELIDEVASNILLNLGDDWSKVTSIVETNTFSYKDLWLGVKKIIINLELLKLIPGRVDINEFTDRLTNKYKRLNIGLEWLLKTELKFETLNEFLVGLILLYDYLGGNLTQENKLKIKSGIPKHEKKDIIDNRKIPELLPEQVASFLGFVKE